MRKQFAGFLCLMLVAGMTALSPALGADAAVQKFDKTEVPILKHTMLWQPDPALQKYLGTKVTVEGEMVSDALTYTSVKPYEETLPHP